MGRQQAGQSVVNFLSAPHQTRHQNTQRIGLMLDIRALLPPPERGIDCPGHLYLVA